MKINRHIVSVEMKCIIWPYLLLTAFVAVVSTYKKINEYLMIVVL